MFRHMEYIYCVYQEKSFSRAAERLYISQSSLSLTIKKAEERIGTPIFDRKTTPLSLTEFGEEYISAVEKVMRLRDGLDNFLYETEHLSRGHISLGAANFCISYLLPPLLTAFRQAYPKIQVELHERSTPSLIRMLSEGRIDMMISNMALDDRFYQGTPFCQEHMVLVIPKELCPEGPLKSAGLSFEQFQAGEKKEWPDLPLEEDPLPVVLLRPGNDSRDRADRLLAQRNIHAQVVLELDQLSTAYQFACSGLGATVVSDILIQRSGPRDQVLYYPLAGEAAERQIQIYIRRNHPVTRVMDTFLQTAKENMAGKG